MKFITAVLVTLALISTCGSALAEDTDIYGVSTSEVKPNVLIIFDNSGSMGDEADSADYDPTIVYDGDGTYNADTVYYEDCSGWFFSYCTYEELTIGGDDVNDVSCDDPREELLQDGYSNNARVKSDSPYRCGNRWDRKDLILGNYINYTKSPMDNPGTKLDVAKSVIKKLITDNSDEVRFGLMVFNEAFWEYDRYNSDGGNILAEVGTPQSGLLSRIDGIKAETNTPLAETLAEAGLYFAGKQGWFDDEDYASPIEYRCQKNYIILMTDGEPTSDDHDNLVNKKYINDDYIRDSDGDGKENLITVKGNTDFLDDVAHYLYTKDVYPDDDDIEASEGAQNIRTYTIGFKTNQVLLKDTAVNGGGEYKTAENYSDLYRAFDDIMSSISEESSTFVAPVVPVSRMNRAYAGDKVYLGFFKPTQTGRWFGNIKSYILSESGEILGADGEPATDEDGLILRGARSRWSLGMDGSEVTAGGTGEKLAGRTTPRNLYTYTGINPDLTDSTNRFAVDNTEIPSPPEANVFNEVEGADKEWPLGDFIHSEPVIVHYHNDTNADGVVDDGEIASYIFAGANDGMLHCFSDEDGSETWGFVPPDQIARLSLLLDSDHHFFVDGSPAVFTDEDAKILIFGERRGGTSYYAIDITDPTTPEWKYSFSEDLLVGEDSDGDSLPDGAAVKLGESWTRPQVHMMKAGGATNPTQDVFLFGGGYDTNQDKDIPAATDTVGRAIFTVDVRTGAVGPLNVNAANFPAMTHSIVDVAGMDPNGDGITNRVYAGDLGGHVFALEDDDMDGTWEPRVLLDLPQQIVVDGQTILLGQKFMYAPDATAETYGEFVFIGSGDREHPLETDYTDAMYAIRNYWTKDESGNPESVAFSDLSDVTENLIQVGDNDEKVAANNALAGSMGWYLRLSHPGEKIVSSPSVFAGTVYFTTFAPPGEDTSEEVDVCSAPADRGTARLYALDYRTGAASFDFDEDGTKTTEDRSIVIGTSIPSSPAIVITKGGPKILIGTEGKIPNLSAGEKTTVQFYYWRQLFN